MDRPMTFFELVDRHGGSKLARMIGIDKSIISRCARGLQGLNDDVMRACAAHFGEGFDFDRTAADWARMRLERDGDGHGLTPSSLTPTSQAAAGM